MSKEETIKLEGQVIECLPNATFRVKLNNTQTVITAVISGKIRKHNINILNLDRVEIEMSPYDLTKGRITFRFKG